MNQTSVQIGHSVFSQCGTEIVVTKIKESFICGYVAGSTCEVANRYRRGQWCGFSILSYKNMRTN